MRSRFQRFTAVVRVALITLLSVPVAAGLLGVIAPAFGYFPALGHTQWSLTIFAELASVTNITTMAWLSFSTGLMATMLATLGALCILAVFYHHAYLSAIQRWLSPLLVLPHAAAAIALLFVLSPSGAVARLISGAGTALPPQWAFPYDSHGLSIIFALALKELPFIFLMALSVLSQPQFEHRIKGMVKSAQALGYAPVTAFTRVALPALYPHLRLPLLAVLAFATANVEIPLLLGPNDPPTLAVAILQWFNHVDISLRLRASAAAVLQLGVTLLALIAWLAAERRIALVLRQRLLSGRREAGASVLPVIAYTTLLGVASVGAVMLIAILMWSLATYWPFPSLLPEGLTLLHWQTSLAALNEPLINTLVLALTVSITAVALVLLTLEAEQSASHSRARTGTLLGIALYLPLLVPGVAFLFGLVWFQQAYLPNAVWLPVFISHLLYVLPYVFISLAVAYRRFDARYVKVAYGLGKSPWQVFSQLKLPLLLSPVLVAFALGLAISYSQYLPTLLSTGGRLATVTTEAVAIASGSSRRLTAVYVIIQMLLPLAGFALAWWLPRVLYNPAARYSFISHKDKTL